MVRVTRNACWLGISREAGMRCLRVNRKSVRTLSVDRVCAQMRSKCFLLEAPLIVLGPCPRVWVHLVSFERCQELCAAWALGSPGMARLVSFFVQEKVSLGMKFPHGLAFDFICSWRRGSLRLPRRTCSEASRLQGDGSVFKVGSQI